MTWDAIVIGSGFGGAMAAHALVYQGHRVLMVERGGWVARGPDNWGRLGAAFVSTHFNWETPYRVNAGWRRSTIGSVNCVGGQSVFYGGASFRFREADFESNPYIVGDSGAAWPFRYADLEPAYAQVERLLCVAGENHTDLTEPPRSAPFTHALGALAPSSQAIANAATRLGMHPSRIPLAIAFDPQAEQARCIRCGTCDGYACAAEAKHDIATAIIPALIAAGMTLKRNTVCVRVLRNGSRVTGVAYVDRVTGERGTFDGHTVILAAGTLATPHLLLASKLERVNPAIEAVGRYLTRHCNTVVFGLFRRPPNATHVFDKQVAINDLCQGATDNDAPPGPLGGLQQLTLPAGLVRAALPAVLRGPVGAFLSRASGLLAIAEDQPNRDNGVHIHRSQVDRFGLPRLEVRHRYSERDRTANRALTNHAKAVLREAGAFGTWVYAINTFSHALGTVRMGPDERSAPLDAYGRYRGLDNLFVTDGSALPRSAGLNPSLTIAANALRIGAHIASYARPSARVRGRRLPVHV